MQSLVWSQNMKMEKMNELEPQISLPFDVKIKVHYSGICGTDLHLINSKEKSKTNIIRGHEAVGTITEVGTSVKNLSVGDRVVIDPNQFCWNCYYCRLGKTNLCENLQIAGITINGTFAKYFVCSQNFVYKLPQNMLWETAVMLEPLACVLNNFDAAKVNYNDSVLILGSGPMGLVCQLVSKRVARFTVGSELSDFRLKFSKKICDYAYHPNDLNIEEVFKINSNRKFDVVIDCVGNQMELAEQYVDKGGRIICLGINKEYVFSCNPSNYTADAISIIGAGEYNLKFEDAVKFAESIPALGELVTKVYSLDDFEIAFEELSCTNIQTVKTVFETDMD